jgi:hypothetical protein
MVSTIVEQAGIGLRDRVGTGKAYSDRCDAVD